MGATSIEWTDETWNPTRGCSRVSPGCDNCYAMGIAYRFSGPGKPFEGFATLRKGKPDWTGKLALVTEHLGDPLTWRKPRKVFVNSMSDLFHPALSNEEIAAVFGVMAACPQHTFQVLTKRPERAAEWFRWFEDTIREEDGDVSRRTALASHYANEGSDGSQSSNDALHDDICNRLQDWLLAHDDVPWPLPNVWMGTSVENQEQADKRIPHLQRCPAAIRFLSCEPLLSDLRIAHWLSRRDEVLFQAFTPEAIAVYGDGPQTRERVHKGIDWVIVGGESGHGARPFDIAWARSIRDQCKASGTAFFMKQLGADPCEEVTPADPEFGRIRVSATAARRQPSMRVGALGRGPIQFQPLTRSSRRVTP